MFNFAFFFFFVKPTSSRFEAAGGGPYLLSRWLSVVAPRVFLSVPAGTATVRLAHSGAGLRQIARSTFSEVIRTSCTAVA